MCAKKAEESRLERLERRLEAMRLHALDVLKVAGGWLNLPKPPPEMLTPFSEEPAPETPLDPPE